MQGNYNCVRGSGTCIAKVVSASVLDVFLNFVCVLVMLNIYDKALLRSSVPVVSSKTSEGIQHSWTSSSRARLSLIRFPVLPLLDLESPISDVFALLLALLEQLQIARFTSIGILLRAQEWDHDGLLEVLEHKAGMVCVDRIQLFLQAEIVPHGLRDVGADLFRSIDVVHVGVDHEKGALGVGFRDARVGHVVSHPD